MQRCEPPNNDREHVCSYTVSNIERRYEARIEKPVLPVGCREAYAPREVRPRRHAELAQVVVLPAATLPVSSQPSSRTVMTSCQQRLRLIPVGRVQ